MAQDIRKWSVEYSHADGRSGTVEVTTEVTKSGAFDYGNRKSGCITVGDFVQPYDLRYNNEKDLHRVMLKDYFGKGLVKATRL